MYKLYIKNAKELVVITKNHEKMLIGKDMDHVEVMNNSSVIVGKDGLIVDLGDAKAMDEKYANEQFEQVIDATDKIVLPGFVDAHTHPVFAGDRCREFSMKMAGATYMDIHKAGGGIHFTVDHTRKASEEELYKLFEERLARMVKQDGLDVDISFIFCTLVECKSGYGLDAENEIKMLKVITRAAREHNIGIVSTFLGAHAVPRDKTVEEGYQCIIQEMIPQIVELREKGELQVDFIDSGVYDVDYMRKILLKGKENGFKICFHADELSALSGAEMGAELGAINMSHLEEITEQGILDMAKSKSVACLLPSTAFILRITPPPARKMIENNVPVAIASDYNPNAHCLSMPYIMSCACIILHLTLNEALVAATLNAAAAIDKSDEYGSIEVGKHGDFVIMNAPDWHHIIYEFADPQIETVIHNGDILYKMNDKVNF